MLVPAFLAWLEATPDYDVIDLPGQELTYGELAEVIRLSSRYDAGSLLDLSVAIEEGRLAGMAANPSAPAGTFYVEIDLPAARSLQSDKHQQCLVIGLRLPEGILLRFFGRANRLFVDTRLGALLHPTGSEMRVRPLVPAHAEDPARMLRHAERMAMFVVTFLDALILPAVRVRKVTIDPGINQARAACKLPPSLDHWQLIYPKLSSGPTVARLRRAAMELTAGQELLQPAV